MGPNFDPQVGKMGFRGFGVVDWACVNLGELTVKFSGILQAGY